MKRKGEGTPPCMGEEKGRQTGVTGGSPATRRERADGLRGALLAVDKEKVLGWLVCPATAAVTAENLRGCWIFQFFSSFESCWCTFCMFST